MLCRKLVLKKVIRTLFFSAKLWKVQVFSFQLKIDFAEKNYFFPHIFFALDFYVPLYEALKHFVD